MNKHILGDIAVAVFKTLKAHGLNVVANLLPGHAMAKLDIPKYSMLGKLLTVRQLTQYDVDGRVVDGPGVSAWAKFHMRKPLPVQTGKPILAGEDTPHRVDDFSGIIGEGYGAGMKKLIYAGNVVVKIGKRTFVTRANLHEHNAKKAGLHYDFVAARIKPGTKEFEVNIPSGTYKGRYAFFTTEDGRMLVGRMKDSGVVMAKPRTILKSVEWLSKREAGLDVVEFKADGGLAIASIESMSQGDAERVVYTSWREQAPAYYQKLPALEYLRNNSGLWMCRTLFKPDLRGTVMYVELFHKHGAARVGGILNSGADKAILYQQRNGYVSAYILDVVKYRGRRVYDLPYAERRLIVEELASEIRPYNKFIQAIPKCPSGVLPLDWYLTIVKDPRGLPWSEGVMVKPLDSVGGDTIYKIKHRDFVDVEVLDFVEGTGKYKGTLGRIVVKPTDVSNGIGEVGSFQITNAQRDWIWENRASLCGQVAEVSTQGRGSMGAVLKGVFFRWHPTKSDAALLMYAVD